MLFYSPVYIFIFLPIVLLVFYVLNDKESIAVSRLWLIFASLFFYSYWNISYLILILASIIINFSLGRMLHFSRKNNSQGNSTRKLLLATGILFNLGLLTYYKYSDFFIQKFIIM